MNLTALAIRHTVKATLLKQIQGVDLVVAASILRELADEVEGLTPDEPVAPLPPPPPRPAASAKDAAEDDWPGVESAVETPAPSNESDKSKAQRMRDALAAGPRLINELARSLAGVGPYLDGRSVQGRRQKLEIERWKQIAVNLVRQGDLERTGGEVRLRKLRVEEHPPAKPPPKASPPKVFRKPKTKVKPEPHEEPEVESPVSQPNPEVEEATIELGRSIMAILEPLEPNTTLSFRSLLDMAVRRGIPAILVKEPGSEGAVVRKVVDELVSSGALVVDSLDSSRVRRG
jgi:hypothetical protein